MKTIKGEVTKFRVWREGTAVKWRCTYADLARALGIHRTRVRQICIASGWVCAFEEDKAEALAHSVSQRDTNRVPVDRLMSKGFLQFHI